MSHSWFEERYNLGTTDEEEVLCTCVHFFSIEWSILIEMKVVFSGTLNLTQLEIKVMGTDIDKAAVSYTHLTLPTIYSV